ncbi:MAG: hypothetical protein M1835_004646 [Candelina submexicana]|nr:MAG: hypothetical protein M1835_004646 [Candelina submexicana]
MSEPVGAGLMVGKAAEVTTPKQQQMPVVGIPMLNKLKRKRVNSDGQSATRPRSDQPSKHRVNCAKEKAPEIWNRAGGAILKEQATQRRVPEALLSFEPTFRTPRPVPPDAQEGSSMELDSEMNDFATLTPLQQTIEGQFGLEILLKHNELRLIDQELAKCQIALEQLRRCSIIPYPTESATPSTMTAVSSGSGPAKEEPWRGAEPQHPAPWGVTDGPYTRHYAKWLIPDRIFEGGYVDDAHGHILPQGSSSQGARSTRYSHNGISFGPNQSRSQRGSSGSNFQALSTAYPLPREKAGPLIIKRTTDGQYVKLVCLDCERGDFSSAQGFINHCRIAHHRGFESHDAAAIACGHTLDASEAGTVIDGTQSGTLGTAGLVHPFIKSASPYKISPATPLISPTPKASDEPMHAPGNTPYGVFDSTPKRDSMQSSSITSNIKSQGCPPFKTRIKEKHEVRSAASAFVPSPQTPHLSALMRERGFAGDLREIVGQAKAKLEVGLNGSYTSSDDEELGDSPAAEESKDMSVRTNQARRPASGASYREYVDRHVPSHPSIGRMPVRVGMSPAPPGRANSRQGLESVSHRPRDARAVSPRPYHTPYVDTHAVHLDAQTRSNDHGGDDDAIMLDEPLSLNYSPNTTESNPAPSLVSDDGDYEAHSEAESLNLPDGDDEDGYLGICAEEEATDQEMSTIPKAIHSRRASAPRGDAPPEGLEARHISFVSPRKNKKDLAKRFGRGVKE